jgi:predicted O-methyltransferase YrrM
MIIEHEKYFRPGMGTENVAPFLRTLIQMVRPQRILEIGAGYTTPFLLEGLELNNEIINEGNLDQKYVEWHKKHYDPKLVVIDNMSLGELKKDFNIDSKYIEFVQGDFKDKSEELFKKYGDFDFVWFDCGGAPENQEFLNEYWKLCSQYMIFHFTFFQGRPNTNSDLISDTITRWQKILGSSNVQRIDILEPHKYRQGSITVLKKVRELH